jgi:hypothetical protein
MIQVKKNEPTAALRRMYFHCVDATDGMTPETGEAGGQPQISVGGAAWGNSSGVLVDIGNGRYYVELTQAESNIADRSVIEGRYKSANTAEAIGTTIQIIEYPVDGSVATVKAKTDSLEFTGSHVNAQVKAQDNIDFGALQKTSLNAATPSVTVSDKTGFSLTGDYDAAKTAASLTEIEASLVLAKEATVSTLPTLVDIETSLVIAKEASVQQAISDIAGIEMGSGATLEAIEGSAILAKEASVQQALIDIAGISSGSGATLQEIEESLVLAKEATVQSVSGKVDLIPTTPLLVNDTRLPATLIASQDDVQGIAPTDLSPVLEAVSYIPTDTLRANDIRLPATLIASQDDVQGVVAGSTDLSPVINILNDIQADIGDPSVDATTLYAAQTATQALVALMMPMSGSNPCAITVYKTSTTTPIADVHLTVMNSTETTALGVVMTNPDGETKDLSGMDTVMLDPVVAGYVVYARKAGVTFAKTILTQADIVAGAKIIYGEEVAAEAPTAGDACEVYYYCFMPDAVTPMAKVHAKAKIENLPYSHNNKYHSGEEIDGIYNAATGKVYWHLPWGARVRFYIKYIHKDPAYGTIPETAQARLTEVVDR